MKMQPDYGVDCAMFFSHALPRGDRDKIKWRDWGIVENNCRRAYLAYRALILDKDYILAARLVIPMYRHRDKLTERILNVFNFVSREIYNPGWIKTLEEESFCE